MSASPGMVLVALAAAASTTGEAQAAYQWNVHTPAVNAQSVTLDAECQKYQNITRQIENMSDRQRVLTDAYKVAQQNHDEAAMQTIRAELDAIDKKLDLLGNLERLQAAQPVDIRFHLYADAGSTSFLLDYLSARSSVLNKSEYRISKAVPRVETYSDVAGFGIHPLQKPVPLDSEYLEILFDRDMADTNRFAWPFKPTAHYYGNLMLLCAKSQTFGALATVTVDYKTNAATLDPVTIKYVIGLPTARSEEDRSKVSDSEQLALDTLLKDFVLYALTPTRPFEVDDKQAKLFQWPDPLPVLKAKNPDDPFALVLPDLPILYPPNRPKPPSLRDGLARLHAEMKTAGMALDDEAILGRFVGVNDRYVGDDGGVNFSLKNSEHTIKIRFLVVQGNPRVSAIYFDTKKVF
jgi:hypothetical protein